MSRISTNGNVPVSESGFVAIKNITFTGAAGAGAVGTISLFTITGDVLAKVFGTVTTDLAGALATIEIGISGNTTGFITTTLATDLDTGEAWIDATPAALEQLTANSKILSTNVIATIALGSGITGGVLNLYCVWKPVSANASVVAA